MGVSQICVINISVPQICDSLGTGMGCVQICVYSISIPQIWTL